MRVRFPAASADGAAARTLTLHLVPVLRGTLMSVIFAISLLALWVASVRLVPGWLPDRTWPGGRGALEATGALAALFGALVLGMALLSGLRRWEARIERARAERYRARAREWQESQREQTEATRPEVDPATAAEAILIVDLIRSTELIVEHGDVFFRDLLRRIEAVFIPVARQWRTRAVDGHGDGFLFCFARADAALAALRGMYAGIPAINRDLPHGVEVAFRASLHIGPTITDSRENRAGLAVLKTARLGSVMETLYGRGKGENSLVVSEEARAALAAAGVAATLLGHVSLRGFPGTHPVYQVDVPVDAAGRGRLTGSPPGR